ncbi:carbohydrate sulfotransferase 15-like [Haliotis rufescens]|uniref:carbohydrate sulfotransferase 15-like n=1 Tax=Haliotis rufescens TaxID=6454 RepID=UPI00201F96E9|nr:carbohydrate sulfotransferase 15-like [Haliotis rufescens]
MSLYICSLSLRLSQSSPARVGGCKMSLYICSLSLRLFPSSPARVASVEDSPRVHQPVLPQFKTLREFTSPCWWVQDVSENKCPQTMKRSREPLAWIASNGRMTGETRMLRCLPYFFIIGQCKCGTSDLFSRINSHPDVTPHAMKETQWVRQSQLSESCTSIDTYLYLLQKSANFIRMNHRKDTVSPYILGDGTPAYFSVNEFWDMLPGNEGCKEPCVTNPDLIHHLNPRARLILSLRNPTNR